MSVELTFENANAGRSLRDLHPLPGVFGVDPSATARQMLMQERLSPLHTHLPTLTLPSYATDTGTMSHCNTLQHTATHFSLHTHLQTLLLLPYAPSGMCILKNQLYNHFVYYISVARWLLRIVFPLFLLCCRTLVPTRRTRSAEPSKSRRHLWNIKWRVQVAGTMSNCITLKHTATHCKIHCNSSNDESEWQKQCLTATHCNILQHTATHCNTLNRTRAHCNTQNDRYNVSLQHAATHCILQHTKTHQTTSRSHRYNFSLLHTETHLQHTATRCNTPTDKSRGVTGAMPPCNTPEHTAAHATHCKHTRTNYSTCNTLHQTKRRVGVTGIMSQKLNL